MSNECTLATDESVSCMSVIANMSDTHSTIEQVASLNTDIIEINGNIVIESGFSISPSAAKDGTSIGSCSGTKMTAATDLLSEATLKTLGADIASGATIAAAGDWIPMTTNALNIAISNGDVRSGITAIAQHNTTRMIAPKPIASNSRTTNSAIEGPSTLLIATSANSGANAATTVKALSKPIQMALVQSADGGQMIAVPISELTTNKLISISSVIDKKGKSSGPAMLTIPVSSSGASNTNIRGKPPLITGPVTCKVLPATLITSVTSSPLSSSASATISIAPTQIGGPTATVTTTNSGGITVVSNPISIPVSSSTSGASIVKIGAVTAPIMTEVNTASDESHNGDDTPLSHTLPPLISQNSSISTNNTPPINSQSLSPPTLTPITTHSNPNPSQSDSIGTVKPHQELEKKKETEEFDAVYKLMSWNDGVGTLPGSDLKFKLNEKGAFEMINENDEQMNECQKETNTIESDNQQQTQDTVGSNDSPQENNSMEETKTCINCGVKGQAKDFIRQGRFCSKSCAMIQSTHLRLFTKRNTEITNVKDQQKKKTQTNKKSDLTKVKKLVIEKPDKIQMIDESSLDHEMEYVEDNNEEVEDVVTNTGNYSVEGGNVGSSFTEANFSWKNYLTKENAIAAPIKCFKESQTFPSCKSGFKVGMKLEGIDPQHQSKFCVLSVAEVCGYRLRLHFDAFKELYDFWVNADSPFIFPAGYCDKTDRKLEPPFGMTREEFNWNSYLLQTRSIAAPKQLFTVTNVQPLVVPNGFRVGMKLEAVDRANAALVCVATIADIIDNWLLIHFDGWDDSYDYWAETTSPYIHAINWCRTKGRSLTPPNNYHKSSERFSWEEYLQETKSSPVSPRAFKTRSSNSFRVNMKLEAVDKRNPKLIRVATISHRQSHSIKLHFDCWDEKYDYWIDDDSPDIHPVNWCHKTSHPLQPPPSFELLNKKEDATQCPTAGCNGIGHIRGPKYLSHYSSVSCPYTDSRLDYEISDRLGNRNGDGSETFTNDGDDTINPSPSQSPSPSEANSVCRTQKVKGKVIGARKRKMGLMNNPSNSPVSPHSTNSESAKHSRPSTPSSLTNMTTLHQSIFAMRLNQQQQQEAPIDWEKHAKSALPGVDLIRSTDVLSWTSVKVAEFVDSIPGCQLVGQVFQDELIDGEAFLLLNQNDIVKILGIKLGPAIKIYNSILVIRDNSITETRN